MRALMRRADFYIMRQAWVLKDVQGWAESAATVLSVAISVVASMVVRAIGGAIAGQRGMAAGPFLKALGKELLEEFAEELVLRF